MSCPLLQATKTALPHLQSVFGKSNVPGHIEGPPGARTRLGPNRRGPSFIPLTSLCASALFQVDCCWKSKVLLLNRGPPIDRALLQTTYPVALWFCPFPTRSLSEIECASAQSMALALDGDPYLHRLRLYRTLLPAVLRASRSESPQDRVRESVSHAPPPTHCA